MLEYVMNLLVMAAIAAMSASALNLLVGYTGVFSSAQAALYGVGGYSGALIAMHFSTSVFVVIPVAVVCSALGSVLLALPASRLTGEYFVVASMAFAVVAFTVFQDWTDVTGGSVGLIGVPRVDLFGLVLTGELSYLVLSLVCLALVLLVIFVVVRRLPLGRALAALRDDPVAAQALGVPPFRSRLIAVAISSALSGIGGAVYAGYIGFINADSFSVDASILFFAMVILGGAGTIWGPVVGAVIVTVLPAVLDTLSLPPTLEGPLEQLLYGVIIVVLMIVKPSGITSAFVDLGRLITGRRRRTDELPAAFAESTDDAPVGGRTL
jgi:branched-chain amino acid transport system permease protein